MANAKDKKIKLIVMLLVAVLVAVGSVYFGDDAAGDLPQYNDMFSVHFIDVGQGDCTLIKTDKGNMLIDAGENGNESTVINYLKDHGVETITYLIATHPHSDHIGGMEEVIRAFNVENVIMPKLTSSNTPTTKTYENMLLAIKESNAKVIAAKPGNDYSFGDVSFKILSPFKQDDNLNNMSVSLKLSYGGYNFVFTGDAEKDIEKQILDKGYDVSADVFKASHHGSSTSNTKKFIQAINPAYVVISYGVGNSYGHPHDETIELFDSLGINYCSTAESGTIIFSVVNNELVLVS